MAKTKAIQGELVVDEIAIRSQFQFDETQIATAKQRISSIAVIDRPSFEAAWEIRQDLRGLRVGIDNERKRLTEKSRSYTGMVNDVAKSILEHIIPVEDAVVAKIDHYQTAEAERKKAVEIASQKALQVRIDALMAVEHVPNSFLLGLLPDDEYQTLLAESTKEFLTKKLAEEQERIANELAAKEKADRESAERKAADDLRASEWAEMKRVREEQEIERKRLAEERAKLDEQARLQREESQRIQWIEDARLASIKREADRAEADRRARQYEAERLAKAESIKPDAEKLNQFAASLRLIAYPIMATNEGERMFDRVRKDIESIAKYCEEFGHGT